VPRTVAGSTATAVAPVVTRPRSTSNAPIEVVTVATSTGGPNALEVVLTSLPADLPVPIVIVQHMPPLFSRLLAERLDTKTGLHIVEAEPGMLLRPGLVVIAPGDFHMTLRQTLSGGVEVRTNQDAPENSCRPAADVLFRSVAAVYGPRALGVVMTGMGHDGLAGSRALVDAGAEVVVQNEATSVVWGMPGAVAGEGLASDLLPLDQIASTIDRRVRRHSTVRTPAVTGTASR
jgi:two-component system chemotaxis response regulator CheB